MRRRTLSGTIALAVALALGATAGAGCRLPGGTNPNRRCPAGWVALPTGVCAALDRDGDGIRDDEDRCPEIAGDVDGGSNGRGCPIPVRTSLPTAADGGALVDGGVPCDDGGSGDGGSPAADRDHDGIADAADRCPDAAETINGFADEDGCPDEKPVMVAGSEIKIAQRIEFARAANTLAPPEVAAIDEICELLRAHPELRRVAIEGHSEPSERAGLRLSERRAARVRGQLIDCGIDAGRLEVRGYGATRPVAPNRTADGRARNRRVEFQIQ